MTYNKVCGNKVLIFGDLHFSDVFTGKHKDYLQNCIDCMNQIDGIIQDEKPCAIVFLGDLIGWTETNIRNRGLLARFCAMFREWRKNAVVYAVQGNHDMRGYPDFYFLNEMGFITTGADCGGYFDYYGSEDKEEPEVRFHIVNYGDESRELELHPSKNVSNIVLGHNNYTIAGLTTWYAEHAGLELGMLSNFCGVDLVISGHIHSPSPEFCPVRMPDGGVCQLVYPGCPTRPIKEKGLYDSCFAVKVVYSQEDNSSMIDTITMSLAPVTEIFYDDGTLITEETEDELAEKMRCEKLNAVLGDLLEYRILSGDLMIQLEKIPNAEPSAVKMAQEYLQRAFNEGGE